MENLLRKLPQESSAISNNDIRNNMGNKEEDEEKKGSTTTTKSESLIHEEEKEKEKKKKKKKKSMSYWVLLVTNYLFLFIGSVSSSMLSRFYFIHGGSSRWVSTWIQSAGFPLLLIAIYLPRLFINYTQAQAQARPFSLFTPKFLFICVLVGLMMGLNNFLFSWGISYLSVSTASLLLSSQLAFNLILSVILVKQKVTYLNLNSVILLTLSSVILALGSSHDLPKGLTQTHYFMGFFAILGAGLLFALYLPVMEMVYKKVESYQMVMEMQVVMEIAATVLASIGMALDGGYGEMKKESKLSFNLGEVGYWLTVGFNIVTWQMCFLGTAGIVFLTTSLTGGVCMTALLPMNVLAGVLAYGDAFGGLKVVSTMLCLWGFCSYVYGEYIKIKMKGTDYEDDDEEKGNQEIGTAEIASDVSV